MQNVTKTVAEKLLSEWWDRLGYREKTALLGSIKIEPDRSTSGVYTVNNRFQIAYGLPGYADGTVVG